MVQTLGYLCMELYPWRHEGLDGVYWLENNDHFLYWLEKNEGLKNKE